MRIIKIIISITILLATFSTSGFAVLTPNDPQWTSPDAGLRWGQVYVGLPSAWDFTTCHWIEETH